SGRNRVRTVQVVPSAAHPRPYARLPSSGPHRYRRHAGRLSDWTQIPSLPDTSLEQGRLGASSAPAGIRFVATSDGRPACPPPRRRGQGRHSPGGCGTAASGTPAVCKLPERGGPPESVLRHPGLSALPSTAGCAGVLWWYGRGFSVLSEPVECAQTAAPRDRSVGTYAGESACPLFRTRNRARLL